MTEGAIEEALRLAKEAGFDTPYEFVEGDQDNLLRLIALARASQAQPEPPAGLEQDAKRLLQFAAWVVAEQRDSLGDIYGGDVQDKMQELGILHKVEVTEPCCEELCRCVEYGDFPMDCLRLAFDVDAIAAAPSPITGEKG